MTTLNILSARRALLAGLSALAPFALAGCGGTSGSNNSARIRAVDVAVNAQTANILVNSASANGDQMAFTSTAVSPYLYIAGNRSSSFSYTTTALIPSGATPPAGPTLTLNNNQFYTVFLFGRSDVPVHGTAFTGATDARFLQIVVTDDTHAAPAAGHASVRVVDAAPDAGAVDVNVGGALLSPAYGNLTYQTPNRNFLPAPYVDVPAGTTSVSVMHTGTATPVVASTSVSVSAGKSYTLIITEPTTTPTFGLQTITD